MNKLCISLLACLVFACQGNQSYEGPIKKTIKIGREVSIKLPANPSTGYSWRMQEVMPQDRKLVDVSKSFVPSSAGVMGASGFEVWTFKGLRPGTMKVLFEYLRPWESASVVREAGDHMPLEYEFTIEE